MVYKIKPKYTRGVKKGYVHNWKYVGHWKERKTGPGKWRFTFRATKGKKSGKYGPRRGFSPTWYIRGYQKAVKTGRGRYRTVFRGTKRLVKLRQY